MPICGIHLAHGLCPRSEWHNVFGLLLFGYIKSWSASEMFDTGTNSIIM